LTKVEPSVEKGRSPPVSMTGGAPIPPRAPGKVWTLVPEAAVAVVTAAVVVVGPAPTVAVIVTVTVETAPHALVAAAAVVDAATTVALVVVMAGAVEEVPETPRAALKASAAA
jgi:predicted NAD/FAD-dependent oxidoreductase